MTDNFRVEITDVETEERRGFLSREDDDNPNSNMAVREFSSIDEARQAIKEEIDADRIAARQFAFDILDDEGISHLTTYYDTIYKHWDSFRA